MVIFLSESKTISSFVSIKSNLFNCIQLLRLFLHLVCEFTLKQEACNERTGQDVTFFHSSSTAKDREKRRQIVRSSEEMPQQPYMVMGEVKMKDD